MPDLMGIGSRTGGHDRARVAGVAWLASAGFLLVLAALKAVTGIGDQAGGNILHALANLAVGIGLVLRPGRGPLGMPRALQLSCLWAVVSIAWGAYLMLNGTTHWAMLCATVAALAALVFSADARSRRGGELAGEERAGLDGHGRIRDEAARSSTAVRTRSARTRGARMDMVPVVPPLPALGRQRRA